MFYFVYFELGFGLREGVGDDGSARTSLEGSIGDDREQREYQ